MEFKFNGYPENSYFELDIDKSNLKDYKFIMFTSDAARKEMFKFYKHEMQQGNKITEHNLGYRFIDATGFYDFYKGKKPSWTKFEQFCPSIVYKFDMVNNSVILTPCKMVQTYTYEVMGKSLGVNFTPPREFEFKGEEIVNV